ncbi:MAG: asparagine synthase (glutamine-hydrolyzing) [Candidatus Omnitrophota bacterium]
MCGIAGFLLNNSSLGEVEAKHILTNMCKSIQYRGPDDSGVWVAGHGAHGVVGLGHNRLSIIDLTSAGHQPMTNEDSSIWLTYNGEIYNFIELREHLIKKGHVFKSKTDSEVIIHAYEEWGEDFISRLNGMFSFGLWDKKKETLILVRDRMGQKPLYYSLREGSVIFASEIKAILEFPGFKREIDHAALRKYFLYEYSPLESTVYKDIRKLDGGHLLIFKKGISTIKEYWNMTFKQSSPGDTRRLKELLKDSVEKRLVSDVPLGVFLSGGIDSSSITSLMSEMMPSERIKTFTVGFSDRSFDESRFSQDISKYFKTDHKEELLDPKTMIDIMPEVLGFMDEPFSDASIIPTYLLSKFTKKHVTVALGGDGGDELFCGYDTFRAHGLASMYEKIPFFLKKYIFEKIVYNLPVSFDNISFDFKLKRFLKGMSFGKEVRDQIWLGSFSPQEQKELLVGDIYRSTKDELVLEDIHATLKNSTSGNFLEKIIYIYCKFYLQGDILKKIDSSSMACSLEARSPFLDHRFIEYVSTISSDQKMHGLTTKYILKKAMKPYLPSFVTKRPKKGFGVPIAKWIKDDLKDLVREELSYEKIKNEGILNPDHVQLLLNEHFNMKKDNRKKLWTILMFELWYKRWIKRR